MANADDKLQRLNGAFRVAPWFVATGLLLLPWIAMRFPDTGVDWTASDFVIMGVLLYGCCGLFELASRKSASFAYRAGAALAIGAAFLLIWFNLAVGIIGNEDNPANLMFGAVLVAALAGAFLARFHPRGMMRAMAVAAGAQALVGVIALLTQPYQPEIAVLTVFFTAVWLASAGLFRIAARTA